MVGLAPAVHRVEPGEVDVAEAAALRGRAAADEEEPVAPNRRGTEVVRGRVDRRADVLGCAEGGIGAVAPRDPDVEQAAAAGPVRRHVETQPIGRLDRATVQERRVELRVVARSLVHLDRVGPGREVHGVRDGREHHHARDRDHERQSETSSHLRFLSWPTPRAASGGLPLLNCLSRTVTVSRVTVRVTGCG